MIGDVFHLMFRLRGGLSRDQFGIQHEGKPKFYNLTGFYAIGLFTRALAGTKYIVENHHNTICAALDFICDSPTTDDSIPNDAKLAFFNETRHSFGRSAMLFSGGASLGFYHMGLARALWEQGM